MLFFTFLLPLALSQRFDYPTFSDTVLKNQSYDPLVSPYELSRQTMQFFVSIPMVILVTVDEGSQVVTYIAAVNVTWYDHRLRFDPDILGYDRAVVYTSQIWIPPVEGYNTLELKFPDTDNPSNTALVESSGWASMLIKGKFDTICRCDVEAFPMDIQFCNMDFSTGLYDTSQAVLSQGSATDLILGTPEWDVSTPNVTTGRYTTAEGREFSMAKIIFKLVRNSTFYVYFLILPTLIITVTCLCALLLPLGIEDGEKANIGVAGLLGLTFMLSVIVSEVPRSSKLPLMGKWLIIQMFYCIAAMLWDFPLAFVDRCFTKRPTSPEKWRQQLPTILAAISTFLFVASDIILTIVMFNVPPQPNGPGAEFI